MRNNIKKVFAILVIIIVFCPIYNMPNAKDCLREINVDIKSRPQINSIIEHYDNYYVSDLSTEEELNIYAKRFLEERGVSERFVYVYFTDLDQSNWVGLFVPAKERIGVSEIRISKKLLTNEEYCQHLIERTLIHELTHFICYIKGMPYLDSDEYFKEMAYKNGAYINDGNTAKVLDTKLSKKCNCEQCICDWWVKDYLIK